MKNLIRFPVFLFAIVAIFFVSNILNNHVVFAGIPQIADCKLNNVSQNTAFNPDNSTINIDVFADQPVKFNTISICQEDDPVCSRTTAVKYFTYTTSYLETVNKVWDGKTGGSSPTLVPAGIYKLRATLANQGGESNTPGEYCSINISVDFSIGAGDLGGGDDDGAGTTTATTTTATSTSTTTTPTTTSGGSTSYSVHYIQENLSNYEPTNVLEVSAGRDRLAYIDLPINFEAKHKVSKDLENKSCSYLWTFGDGSALSGEKVEHVYKYTGDYNAVLNGKCNGLLSVSRTSVKVVKPDLLMVQKADGAVEVSNQGKYEINLYGWKLKSSNQEYTFPQDTIISAGKAVTFPAEYLKILATGSEIILVDSAGKSIVQTNPQSLVLNANNLSKDISVADFEKFAVEYKRLTQANVRIPSAVAIITTPSNLNSLPVRSVDLEKQNPNNIPLTASVFSAIISTTSLGDFADNTNGDTSVVAPTRGFWGKLFHPISTIKESFYK